MERISGDMKTAEVLEKYPEAAEVLAEYGMLCGGCFCAEAETLEEACAVHCMDPDAVISLLNDVISRRREQDGTAGTDTQ